MALAGLAVAWTRYTFGIAKLRIELLASEEQATEDYIDGLVRIRKDIERKLDRTSRQAASETNP